MVETPVCCLVTGGAGFVGSHVAERLVALGHPTRVVDNLSTGHRSNLAGFADHIEFVEGDLTNPVVCRRATDGVELVFHLAALPSVPRSMTDPWACHDHNVNATIQLLLACKDAGVRRVVYSSSSSVYGDTPILPKVESMELQPCSPYAAAKLAGEQYVLAFARAGILEGVALRYFNVFGPRQRADSAYAAVIPAFLSAAATGNPAALYGDGNQTRDFTYVDNVVEANLLAARLPAEQVSGVAVNIGAGERTSLRELLAIVEGITGHRVACTNEPPRPGDVRDSLASLERAASVLQFAPTIPLDDGVRRTWEWMVDGASGGTMRSAS